jgi:predicted aminopeptidase
VKKDLPSLTKQTTKNFLILMIGLSTLLAGCSPGYVLQAAYEQGRILIGRRPIEQVILDPETDSNDREKLRLVLRAREFGSERVGLTTGRSFTAYTDIGKDTLAWIVIASRRDSFSLYTWWFPIVGTVPYKGFFNEESAKGQARDLEALGYESSVRGTEAFSTLGWFNDPVLSTTLKNPPSRIVNTVLHESVHSTVWIKNNVAFNESLANFVGSQAALEFFANEEAECSGAGRTCDLLAQSRQQAERDLAFQLEFGDTVSQLIEKLEALYARTDVSSEEKISKREEIFAQGVAPFHARYPKATVLQKINNAEIVQFKLYLTKLRLFEKLYAQSDRNWDTFFARIRAARAASEADSAADPFVVLEKEIHDTVR